MRGRAAPGLALAQMAGLLVALAALVGLTLACGEAQTPGDPPATDNAIASETPGESGGDRVADPSALPSRSPNARTDTEKLLRDDLAAARHPSDGGGRAWLDRVETPDGSTQLRAGGLARLHLVYEAGAEGISPGGVLFLHISPFWYWDSPQARDPEGRAYTTIQSRAEGVELETDDADPRRLALTVRGRALAPGEQIEFVYGAGAAWARIDRYAERESPIWFAVDGDGDGVREWVPDPPQVSIGAGAPARLVLHLPAVARPGEAVRLRAAWVDGAGNAEADFRGRVELEATPGLELPTYLDFEASHRGRRVIDGVAQAAGIHRVRARVGKEKASEAGDAMQAESNPLVVSQSAPRLLWADLHGHSLFSDGSATPEDYFGYARDVAGLDVVALTDHDHFGIQFLDRSPERWQRIVDAVGAYHEPGRFVALLGYEWTNWLHGHRHVLYFADDGPIFGSLDPPTDNPAGLWAALAAAKQPALTVAHHSAGAPVATNWDYVPDPRFEPVTEIVSVHGSSEAMDSPDRIAAPVPGNFVRDVLDQGRILGFVGSGDSHDGHPGLAHLSAGRGGVAAIFSEDRTREGVLSALRARRSYATNGPRIWLRFALDGRPMGSQLPVSESPEQEVDLAVAGTAPLSRVELIRAGRVVHTLPSEQEWELAARIGIPRLEAGEYLYLRVVQEDGGLAWSSPFFAR